jgi:hypothetical protein
MAETKRVYPVRPADALDTASDHMAEMLRRTDELLVEWSRFGTAVRAQVEREANHIGEAVGEAVEGAVRRAAATGIDRAFSEQVGAKLAALSAEIAKLETRARAASRAIGEQQRGDRVILYGLGGAMLIAIGLIVAPLLRQPPTALAPEPVPVAVPAPAPAPEIAPPTAAPSVGSAAAIEPDPKPDPAKAAPTKVEPAKADPNPSGDAVKPPINKGVKVGPPTGRAAKMLALPPAKKP